jgi:hypothetical protein
MFHVISPFVPLDKREAYFFLVIIREACFFITLSFEGIELIYYVMCVSEMKDLLSVIT